MCIELRRFSGNNLKQMLPHTAFDILLDQIFLSYCFILLLTWVSDTLATFCSPFNNERICILSGKTIKRWKHNNKAPTHVCKLMLAECILQIKHMLLSIMEVFSHWIHWPSTAENYPNQEFVNQEWCLIGNNN